MDKWRCPNGGSGAIKLCVVWDTRRPVGGSRLMVSCSEAEKYGEWFVGMVFMLMAYWCLAILNYNVVVCVRRQRVGI